ncbi:MAG: hypothetical protein LBV45_00585, partial [Xanthomonadaceae bacterium]|nr:hypothetical protein [Xanthomonadaceae bacterium]
ERIRHYPLTSFSHRLASLIRVLPVADRRKDRGRTAGRWGQEGSIRMIGSESGIDGTIRNVTRLGERSVIGS